MTPDLDTLTDFIMRVEEWERAGAALSVLLEKIYPSVQVHLPSAKSLSLYQLTTDEGSLLVATSHNGGHPIDLTTILHETAFTNSPTTYLSNDNTWLIGLHDSESALWGFWAIEIAFDEAPPHHIEVWFTLAAKYLARAVLEHLPNLNSPAQKSAHSTQREAFLLYEVNRELLTAQDGKEVLNVLKRHLAPDALALTLAEIEWDQHTGALRSVKGRYLITSTGDVMESQRNLIADASPDFIQTLLNEWAIQGKAVDFIEDTSVLLDERPITRISHEQGIRSVVVIPVYDGDYLTQQVTISFPEARTFEKRTRRIYNAIRDQVTVVLQNRRLAQRTEESLNEIKALYEINTALLAAPDALAVLRVLKAQLAPEASTLNLMTVDWHKITDEVIAVRGIATLDEEGQRDDEVMLSDDMPPALLKQLQIVWRQGNHGLIIFEDIDEDIDNEGTQAHPIAEYARLQGLCSVISIPIYEDDYLIQLVNIGFKSPQRFPPQVRRLYNAMQNQIGVVLQKQHLLKDMQTTAARLGNQVRVLRTINHLSSDLAIVDDEAQLLVRMCEALYNALTVDHVGVAMADANGDTLTVMYEYPKHGLIGTKLAAHGGLQETVRTQRDPLIVNAIKHHAGLSASIRETLGNAGIQSTMICPIFDSDGRFLGSIGLDIYDERRFTSEMRDIARTITAQVAVTLQNVRLVKRTQQQAERMAEIARLGQQLQASLEIPNLLITVLEGITGIIQADHINIVFYDMAKGHLKQIAWREGTQPPVIADEGQEVRLEGASARRVWITQKAFYHDDLTQEEGLFYTSHPNIRAYMGLLLFSHSRAIGVLEVGRKLANAYTSVDHAILQQIVSQVSVALSNAQAYQESQRLAMSKAKVNEIARLLQQQTELEDMLDVTMREIGKALGARRARLRIDPDLVTALGTSAEGGDHE